MQFTNFDVDVFLAEYWQKKPLLIRNPWSNWVNPLEPDELAGLACEEEIESRLILQDGGTWQLEHGPIAAKRFTKLGDRQWTLLIQAVDHYVPNVAALIEPFRFIPNWRIDDVMVSYAADEGGVGPHFDQYDVFLLQGMGRRRWQIGAMCDPSTERLPHDDLRLLARFEALEEWVLEPGDILYVPPFLAHNGIAVGSDCMTYSIGFRAPLQSELIAHWSDHLLSELEAGSRYRDPQVPPQDNPGEISGAALSSLHAMITDKLLDRDAFARWFGAYNSARKYPDVDWQPEERLDIEELRTALNKGGYLSRNPASRFSFIRQSASVVLFVDGGSYDCKGELGAFAQLLCARAELKVDPAIIQSDAAVTLIATLYNQGSITLDQEN